MTITSKRAKLNNKLLPILMIVVLLSSNYLFAQTQDSVEIEFTGTIKARFPQRVRFEQLATSTTTIPAGTMLCLSPSFLSPLASDTVVKVFGHNIRFFPGALMSVDNHFLKPVTGRFHFHSNLASFPVKIAARRYSGEYSSGDFWLEVTADNGTFMAMTDKGQMWVKDEYRRVIELKPSQEIHVPLFGETVITERLTSRWELPPEGFAVTETRLNEQATEEPDKQDSEKLASDSIEIEENIIDR